MVLVDTSVWVDFFANSPAPHVGELEFFLRRGRRVCICGVILTEVLQGVRADKEYRRVKRHLDKLLFLPMIHDTYVRAADIYRLLRRKGITVRKPLDCMIASVAIEHGVPLLHNDRDFNPIEKHCGLKVAHSADYADTHI